MHKLDNSTNPTGFISKMAPCPKLKKQTWILSQTCCKSGILFKCLNAYPAAGFPETKLGESSSCRKNVNRSMNNTKGFKNSKCWFCGSSHPSESHHIVRLYCMPVLDAMLDQGSRERSRDWAWRYNLWGREQGLRLAIVEPMCWI